MARKNRGLRLVRDQRFGHAVLRLGVQSPEFVQYITEPSVKDADFVTNDGQALR